MRHSLHVSILAVALLLLAPSGEAQDLPEPALHQGALASQAPGPCSTWGLRELRGTYAFTANAWQDLSAINPALPAGYAPVTIIGVYKVNGNGAVTGSAWINAGGLQLTAEFINSQFGAPGADCTFPLSLSMEIKEFGEAVAGPYSYAGVVMGDGSAMELSFMMLGTGPGSHVESNHAKRISMRFE